VQRALNQKMISATPLLILLLLQKLQKQKRAFYVFNQLFLFIVFVFVPAAFSGVLLATLDW